MEAAEAKRVEDGSVVRGLFLDSARFDTDNHCIAEANPRELFVSMPYFHIRPRHVDDIEPIKGSPVLYTGELAGTAHVYNCPVYKVTELGLST